MSRKNETATWLIAAVTLVFLAGCSQDDLVAQIALQTSTPAEVLPSRTDTDKCGFGFSTSLGELEMAKFQKQRHNQLRTTLSQTSGGHGILLGSSSQASGRQRFISKLLNYKRVIAFVLLLVVCGHLRTFGNSFSTKSAHFCPAFGGEVLIPRRRRRKEIDPAVASIAASYSRFSSQLQDDSSIDQQQRKCRERAEANGHSIEYEFADQAVSGTTSRRAGLDSMLQTACEGKFGVLYLFSLSRLGRESQITMGALKKLVNVYHVRVISICEGIDSAKGEWTMPAQVNSMMDEQFLQKLRAAVITGQEQNVVSGFSNGHYCFGYDSEPVPGTEFGRGHNRRQRRCIVIHPEHANWVKKIFVWFVEERRSLNWIAKELTRLNAPKDHRSSSRSWTHNLVRGVLTRRKYIGWWPWRESTNNHDPDTGDKWQEERTTEEAEQWTRHLPELAFIDEEMFAKAQEILAELKAKYAGSRREDGVFNGNKIWNGEAKHLLQELVECEECEECFQVRGKNGKYLGCGGYKKNACTCKTKFRRDIAERMICEAISREILDDPTWVDQIIAATTASWNARRASEPDARKELEAAIAQSDIRIGNLVDRIERGDADPSIDVRLQQRRQERQQLVRQLAKLSPEKIERLPPTREWVGEQLQNLRDVLTTNAAEANRALRALVGSITVAAVQPEHRKRQFIRAKFTISLASVAASIGATEAAADLHTSREIVLDFVEPPPWERLADEIKAAVDTGATDKELAEEHGWHRSWIAKGLAHWHKIRSLAVPDRRGNNGKRQQPKPPEEDAG